ncbi:sperm-associated antigen 5 [Perognathus longimembris pacificus]|uniref:sperm-associated antigen 5 n=1 Tax=Perognathus longimembris pacificus TaxID=214514 RepID=UPI002019455B|nr:sperm-associated antigen 5 [Perognathus longimembris pacificus]
MWRVKTLNLGLSPSPQPAKPAMRTPLREIILQPGALTTSGEGPPMCSSLTPSLRKLGLQEGNNNSSPMDFINAKRTNFSSEQTSHPSKWVDVGQHESDEQPVKPTPQTDSTSKISAETVNPADDYVVKTMVLTPSPVGQKQDMILEAHSDTIAEINNSSLNELLKPGDLVSKEVALRMEESLLETVGAMPEEPPWQDSSSHLLGYPLQSYSGQPLGYSKESLRDERIEVVPEDLVLSESTKSSSRLGLSPSVTWAADFPVNHEEPGEEMIERLVTEEREISFSTFYEEVTPEDHALISDVEDVPSSCLTLNPVEMESQAGPNPAVEDTGRFLGCDSETWMSPLAWLEKGVNTSVMLENLRQSLSLPPVLQDAAVSNSPLSTCSVGTWFTPPAPQEKCTHECHTEGAKGTKASTSETKRFLWGRCPPDLTTLSRPDLESNLLSSLGLLEILSCQLQACKSHLIVSHPEARDSSTQTDTSTSPRRVIKKPQHLQESQKIREVLEETRNIMQSWVLASKELISLLHLSLLHDKEDRMTVSQESQRTETLVSCCYDMMKKLRAKFQSLITEREEAKRGEEMALKGKDAAETVLEVFCAHATQRISHLQQDLTSMQEFRALLQEAQTQLVGLHTEQEELAQQVVSLTTTLQQDWTSMQLDYVTWTALLGRSRQLTEKVTAKSRQALQERDTAIEEKQQISRELEQVSIHLEECKGQLEQLKLENSCLATDLQAQLQILASTDSQLKELQSQHAHCAQDLAMKDELLHQLTQSNEEQAAQWQKEEMALRQIKAELQQQKAVLAKEVQDLKETLEFADQESQVAHLELGQVECQLKTTLDVLRERSLQCENLKDTVENLKADLTRTIAEKQEQALEKAHQYSQRLGLLTDQLQHLSLFLQTQLKEKTKLETLLLSTDCVLTQEHPEPNDSALLGNTLTAAADEEPEPAPVSLVGSDTSAFTRVTSTVSLQPTETPDLESSLEKMSTTLLELESLCSLLQESKEEAIGFLQQKIYHLQARLQAQEEEHQEAQKAKEADIEKLNQALCLRYKNEKELQEVIQKQNEKILEQIDKSGELISLREEVTQLTRLLRHAETETKVLQETLAGQLDPTSQSTVANWIQEKVCLSQEVDKLRLMFLEMKNEKANLVVKYQSHRNILEENLRRSDTELKKLDDIVQHIYETLLSIPEVVRSCKELQGLLEFLS